MWIGPKQMSIYSYQALMIWSWNCGTPEGMYNQLSREDIAGHFPCPPWVKMLSALILAWVGNVCKNHWYLICQRHRGVGMCKFNNSHNPGVLSQLWVARILNKLVSAFTIQKAIGKNWKLNFLAYHRAVKWWMHLQCPIGKGGQTQSHRGAKTLRGLIQNKQQHVAWLL